MVARVIPGKRFMDIAGPVAFYVTDRKTLPGGSAAGILERIRLAAIAKLDFVQIREQDLSTSGLLKMAREAIRIAREISSTRLIVNDRLDVALAAGASGVHLGRESLPIAEVVNWCRVGNAPADFVVGVSCHGAEEARAAENAGANYVFFGPVFDTPSKRSFGPPLGLELLRDVCGAVETPVIAIGGANESTAADCIKAGARGIAAIRLIQEARDANALAATIDEIHRIPLA
jgi:thiamine-phosphate pyrophosphorylase